MVDRLLIEAGSNKSRILMATIYLADLSDFKGMHAVWDAWLGQANLPPQPVRAGQFAFAGGTGRECIIERPFGQGSIHGGKVLTDVLARFVRSEAASCRG